MKPYPFYNESGIEWVGEIPSEWDTYPMKYGLSMITEKGQPETGDIKISPENVGSNTGICLNYYSDYSGEGVPFITGDILLNKLRLYLKKILFTEYDGFSMGEMIVLRTKENLFNKYLFFILFNQGLIDLLNSQSNGVKLPRVSPEVILNTDFVYPPIQEQQQISNYLDHKSKQIDSLIDKTQQKIELLKEQRTSLINQVVTKGLNPDVKMKESSVEWIGEIPSGWTVCQIKQYLENITDGAHISPDTSEESYPFVSTVDIGNGVIDFDNCLKTSTESYSLLSNQGCQPKRGDVLFSKDGTVGKTALIDFERDFVVASSLIILTPQHDRVNSMFLNYVLRSYFVLEQINSLTKGSALKRVSLLNLKKVRGVFPPLHEQQQIVGYLDKETSKIDSLIEKEGQRVDLLKEYRQSLISEVVTGKVDVRDEVVA